MSLIKAIAAQIASSNAPLRIQLHLICTFRTRSELHAYGSFLHQITRDPRFTSWLHVEIYVSRPDKPQTLMGAHAHVIKNDIQVPGPSIKKEKKKRFQSLRRTGTMLKRALSGRTIVEKPSTAAGQKEKAVVDATATAPAINPLSFSSAGKHVRNESIDTVVDLSRRQSGKVSHRRVSSSLSSEIDPSSCSTPTSPTSPVTFAPDHDVIAEGGELSQTEPIRSTPTRSMTYDTKRLPTFQDANSASLATKYARLDLHATAIMIVLPLGVWYLLRAIHWEGSARFCDVMEEMDQRQMKICYGTYSTIPEFGHVLAMALVSYVVMWYARRSLFRSLEASSLKDLESGSSSSSSSSSRGDSKDKNKNLPYPELDLEDEKLSVEDGNWDEGDVVFSRGRVNVKQVIEKFMVGGVGPVGGDPGEVTVFGAGPEAFVEHCERQVKAAKWAVDFHRETWAP